MGEFSILRPRKCLICGKRTKGDFCREHRKYSEEKDQYIIQKLSEEPYTTMLDFKICKLLRVPLKRLRELKTINNIPFNLSEIEKIIFKGVMEGKTRDEMAKQAGIVPHHVSAIKRKLGIS